MNKYEKEQDKQDKQREQIIEHIVSTILTKINYEVEQSKGQNIQNSTLVDILQGMNNNITGENVIEEVEAEAEEQEEAEDEAEEAEEADEQVGLVEEADEQVGLVEEADEEDRSC